jgi:MFS family permease
MRAILQRAPRIVEAVGAGLDWRRDTSMNIQALSPRQRRLSLVAVNICVLGVGAGIGGLIPLMALNLEHRGMDSAVIGLNAAMYPIAVVAVGPFIPRLIGRLGTIASLYLGLAVTALSIILLPLLTSLTAWFALRLLMGAASSIQWVVTETWLNIIATERDRGRIMGIYAAVIAGGIAVGPLIIGVLGTEGWPPFLAIVLAIALSALPLPLARGLIPPMPEEAHAPILALMRAQPLIVACGLVGGVTDFALFALLPIYALQQGLTQSAAVLLLSLFVGGNVVLQFPIGWFADRSSRRTALLLSAVLLLAGAVAMPFAIGTPLAYPLVFIWGGASFALYTLGLGLLGDGFPRAQLAAANMALIMAYEVGGAGGPALAGAAMDAVGPQGLIFLVALASLALLAFLLRQRSIAGTK